MTIRAFRHFETTQPIVITCSRCLAPVIYGLAEGSVARVDAVPVHSEAGARAAGRRTYTLSRSGLVYRDDSRRTDPDLSGPVLADHACPNPRLVLLDEEKR